MLCVRVRVYAGKRIGVLEHVHLLPQVEAEQAVEAAQIGLSGEVQPHDLVQVPVLWKVTNHESLSH